ncbi:MAG: hypothetical protein AB1540_11695 [Bdellovibrionota bacterium]
MYEAAIDIGTNTMLMLVADISYEANSSRLRRIGEVVEDHIDFVRLGQGVHQNRSFAPEAMQRSLKCFHKYKEICERRKVSKVHAVATSASRDASNSKEFYDRVYSETGIRVQIIPGALEARLSFLGGLLPFQKPKNSVILDIGGGSTEFVAFSEKNQDVYGQSVDIGSVRATEMFLKENPYKKSSLEAMERHLKQLWQGIDLSLQLELRQKEWTGIAGTPTTLAGISLGLQTFDAKRIDGYRLDRCMVGDLYESLAIQTQAQRAAHPLMGTGRADIMVAGVAVLYTAMEFFGKPDIIISSRGLRHGVLLEPPTGLS